MIATLIWMLIFVPLALAPGSAAAQAAEAIDIAQAATRLRDGGYLLMMRHAQTEAGVGDPPGFTIGDCATQRNLSEQGREQARRVGARFAQAGIRIDSVRTSQWCRCRETARLAFGARVRDIADWPVLNSFFSQREQEAERSRAVLEFARKAPPRHNTMLVTHQVNITAIGGQWVDSAEIVAFQVDGERLQMRFRIKPP